ncbi:MAG: MBL fold metallo-hydrolase [Acidimicrobiales bacterium]
MIFEQYYLECLSQASYLIGDSTTGRAVVVDPRRDIQAYLDALAEHGLTLELVLETHFHADFLSGHLELAEATGAEIGYSSVAETGFPSRKLVDGERIPLGEVTLEIRHTPGHTPESISIVIYDHPGRSEPDPGMEPFGVLTGDTLFIGDVGRPDLLSSVGVSADDLANDLYDSLHGRLLTLPDATRVYPGHGAGSACGKNLSTETVSTIGDERATNYALAPMTREQFVAAVTDGQPSAPAYFLYDALRNRAEHPIFHESDALAALGLDEVVQWQRRGAAIVDTREPTDYSIGHLIGSVNVGLSGRYAEYVGGVIQPGAPIVLVAEPGTEAEARTRLARIGFDHVVGYLENPLVTFEAHPDDVTQAQRIDATELAARLAAEPDLQVVDVRGRTEADTGMIPGARLVPLPELNRNLGLLDASKPTVAYCAGGYRSSIGASRLRAAGFTDVSDLLGGYGAWAARQNASLEESGV